MGQANNKNHNMNMKCNCNCNLQFNLLLTIGLIKLLLIRSIVSEIIPCLQQSGTSSSATNSSIIPDDANNGNKSEKFEINDIECSLETLSHDYHKFECVDNDTIRILGEYRILRIFCTASFPLDLEYSGFQPTEAIKVQFSKEIYTNSSRKLKYYRLELNVYSVQALYDKYMNDTASNSVESSSSLSSSPKSTQIQLHTNSRTGRYKIHDVFNKNRYKAIYLFLEDEQSSLALMRNRQAIQAQLEANDTQIIIPCRPSHMNSNVSLYFEIMDNGTKSIQEVQVDDESVTYSPEDGFHLKDLNKKDWNPENFISTSSSIKKTPGYFVCKLNDLASDNKNEREGHSMLRFTFPPEEKIAQYGFEGLPTESIQENINIHSQVVVVDTYNFQINIDCTVDNPKDAILTAIESQSPSHSHLLQEFVFPNYINGSYSGVYGQKSSPPGVMTLKGLGMAGLVFCMAKRLISNETDYKVLEYATGFDRKVRFFKYGQDWSYFNVTESPAVNHLQIIPGRLADDSNVASGRISGYYVNKTYIFRLRLRVHGVCPPVIWYHKFENGTEIEEYIDYELDEDNFSHFNLTITPLTNEVIAAASFWDRQLWKNVSLPIKPTRKDGTFPVIKNTNFEIHFIIGASNQVLKCEAFGDPIPNLIWEKDSQILAKENGTDSLILEFPKIDSSHAGTYKCIAKNIIGTTSKTFTIETVEEEKVNYYVNVGIPTFVFIIATVGTYLYFRYFKKEPVGLTKQEIEAFEQGSPEFTKEMDYMVPENALHVPYNREYEIEEKHFQIATSEILGSGQFGIVYRGIVKGKPVAVKTLKANADKDYLKALLSELKIMCYLGKHEHLVQLIGANTSKLRKGNVYIFVEMCSLGSLEHYLKDNRSNFISDSEYGNLSYVTIPNPSDVLNTQQLYIWSYQISKAMEYLATKKVIHGDLATRNVLIDSDKQAKVTDFGLSRQLYNYELYVKKNQEPLPWRWMSVESLRDLVFSVHSDAWSFGITLWEIFSLAEVPYPGLGWDLEFVDKLERGLRMLKPKYSTQKLYEDVLLPCWHTDPDCRPSFEIMSQYILNLIIIKPIPPHYIRHSDLITNMPVQTEPC